MGTVLSRTGTLARVQWNDNGAVEENVRLGGENLLAIAGTRRHQFLMDLPALIERFTSDPVAVVVELLRESSKGLKAQAIKELLVELGLEPAAVDRAWRGVQAKLAKRDDVRFRANTYRWVWPRPAEDVIDSPDPSAEVEMTVPPVEAETTASPVPKADVETTASPVDVEAMDIPVPEASQAEAEATAPPVTEISPVAPTVFSAVPDAVPEIPAAPPADAGAKATGPETSAPIRKSSSRSADVAAAAEDRKSSSRTAEAAEERARVLAERCERLERDLQSANDRAIKLRTTQERRLQIDVVRALAGLAAEIEEMVTGRATPEIIVERVRSLVAGQALHPIGTVGEESGFDPALHEPLAGELEPGTPVSVIRPGYLWTTPEEILLHRALVEQVRA
ncbi:Molecular chaperone GrpE (heat shock protein) [Streptosporangium subroseum]|uniref:Molecular chaperone GrpE (Heat shock protein) n=1 Tax=Streptosporangium subroseum TaxID=106412 RepID=A0A239AF10_9ACTN|nr:Molecular chaperone GrpE (heat shock protein) [Streptosporangium subroseum]